MNQPTSFLSCAVFLLYLLLLPTAAGSMFSDPDTYWHIAAGDLIRQLGALPEHDSWSFTAGDERWYNIAWGWDVAASFLYQHLGWHGLIAANSIVIALTLALVFANCLVHAREGLSAFCATLLLSMTLYNCSVRPHQVSLLLTAALLLVLAQAAQERISARWLALVPPVMAVWANLHGGFIVAFLLLGLFGLDALLDGRRRMLALLAATTGASLLACLLNPYGIYIAAGVMRTLTSKASHIIHEWQPLSLSPANSMPLLYLFLFVILVVVRRRLPLARGERWIACAWLALSLLSVRNTGTFGIVSAPLLAVALRHSLFSGTARPIPSTIRRCCDAGSRLIHNRCAGYALTGLAAAIAAAMPATPASRFYDTEHFNPLPDLSVEIAYIEDHYPRARLLTSFNLGGPLIFLTRGKIPVFIDGRAETAYPPALVNDYIAFHNNLEGWQAMPGAYHLEGALFLSSDKDSIGRLMQLPGWDRAFRGRTATLIMKNHL